MQNELQFIKEDLQERQIPVSLVEGWAEGGEGATDIARKLTELVKLEQNFKFIYKDSDDIKTKIEMVAKEIYGAIGVDFSEDAIKEINRIEKLGYSNLPVCIAKTQYSFSDDSKNLECKEPFKINIREINLKAGSGFVVAIAGKIMTMPGLPKIPAAETINIDENEKIVGIF